MEILSSPIRKDDLLGRSKSPFPDMVKAVVDVRRERVAIGAELHADLEALLLESGSQQEDLRGINLYPEENATDWIEFTAPINIRPSADNGDMEIKNPEIRREITRIVAVVIRE